MCADTHWHKLLLSCWGVPLRGERFGFEFGQSDGKSDQKFPQHFGMVNLQVPRALGNSSVWLLDRRWFTISSSFGNMVELYADEVGQRSYYNAEVKAAS